MPQYLKTRQEESKQELRTVDRSIVVFVEDRHDRRELRRRQPNVEDPSKMVVEINGWC